MIRVFSILFTILYLPCFSQKNKGTYNDSIVTKSGVIISNVKITLINDENVFYSSIKSNESKYISMQGIKYCIKDGKKPLLDLVDSQSPCDFFKADEITWYGIDFTHAKFIGPDFNDPTEIKDRFFKNWNSLIIIESAKYNIGQVFRKSKVNYSLDAVTHRNDSINMKNIVVFNDDKITFTEKDVPEIVKSYPFDKTSGYGALLFVESFNNNFKGGYFYITIVDLSTKTPVLIKKVSGTAEGLGFRNYWARSVYEALKMSQRNYHDWEKYSCHK